MTLPHNISVRDELRPGDLGRIIALHGKCYESLPGFGLAFEAYVARTVAEYILDSGAKGRIWIAEKDDQLVGCTAIVLREENRGQLRWVLVDQSMRGIGLGKQLVNAALRYCRDNGCKKFFLKPPMDYRSHKRYTWHSDSRLFRIAQRNFGTAYVH